MQPLPIFRAQKLLSGFSLKGRKAKLAAAVATHDEVNCPVTQPTDSIEKHRGMLCGIWQFWDVRFDSHRRIED